MPCRHKTIIHTKFAHGLPATAGQKLPKSGKWASGSDRQAERIEHVVRTGSILNWKCGSGIRMRSSFQEGKQAVKGWTNRFHPSILKAGAQWKFLLFKNLLIKYTAYAMLIGRLLCKIVHSILMARVRERDF